MEEEGGELKREALLSYQPSAWARSSWQKQRCIPASRNEVGRQCSRGCKVDCLHSRYGVGVTMYHWT